MMKLLTTLNQLRSEATPPGEVCCRGCATLGTACGKCWRCKREQRYRDELAKGFPAIQEYITLLEVGIKVAERLNGLMLTIPHSHAANKDWWMRHALLSQELHDSLNALNEWKEKQDGDCS